MDYWLAGNIMTMSHVKLCSKIHCHTEVMVRIKEQMATLFSPYRVAISEGNILKYSSLLTHAIHTTVH